MSTILDNLPDDELRELHAYVVRHSFQWKHQLGRDATEGKLSEILKNVVGYLGSGWLCEVTEIMINVEAHRRGLYDPRHVD